MPQMSIIYKGRPDVWGPYNHWPHFKLKFNFYQNYDYEIKTSIPNQSAPLNFIFLVIINCSHGLQSFRLILNVIARKSAIIALSGSNPFSESNYRPNKNSRLLGCGSLVRTSTRHHYRCPDHNRNSHCKCGWKLYF